MRCMKCGVQIPEQASFCADCLAEMEQHPVRSNVSIQLPPRSEAPSAKRKPRRYRESKPEEQIRRQKRTIRRLVFFLVLVLLAFFLTAGLLLHNLIQQHQIPHIGQNYSTVTEASEP